MKKLLLLLILFGLNSHSQEKGIVYYGHVESNGLKAPLGPDYNAYLLFNNNKSYYVTAKDSLDINTEFKTMYSSTDGMTKLSFVGNPMTTEYGRQVFYNKKKDSMYWNKWVNFYVAEKTPKINWKLEK